MNTKSVMGILVVVSALSLLVNCGKTVSVHMDRVKLLGTFAQISIAGMPADEAETAIRAAETDLQALEDIGFTFSDDNELQQLNRALAEGKTFEVSPAMLELLGNARALSKESGGLFNPAAGELTALWEFRCESIDCQKVAYPDEVRRLMQEQQARVIDGHPGMDDLVVRGNRVSTRNRLVRLEFGDIIRGLALDHTIFHLQQAGVHNALIDIGGSVHTVGSRGDHAWWIGIPDASGERTVGSIETDSNESVVTVRALDRSYGKEGFVYRHVVDPRTGMPVEDIKSVTIVHRSAARANAAAAAIMIAGLEDWKSVADGMDVQQILIINAEGAIYTSPAIDHRIQWKQGVIHKHLVP